MEKEGKKFFKKILTDALKKQAMQKELKGVLLIFIILFVIIPIILSILFSIKLAILYTMIILIVATLFFVIQLAMEYFKGKHYYSSDFYKMTKNSIFDAYFDKGVYEEFNVFKVLEQQPIYKKVLSDLYIPTENNKTTQIDSIMITQYGIYVFEVKRHNATIYGSEDDKTWSYKYKNYGNYFKFNNPVNQNNYHIKTLMNFLNECLETNNSNLYKSYIVFGNRTTLAKMKIHSQNICVCNTQNLTQLLNNSYKNSNIIFTEKKVDLFYNILKNYVSTNITDETKLKHDENMKKYKSN